jgi:hypothetical protein
MKTMFNTVAAALTLALPLLATAAPAVDGDVVISGNRAGTVTTGGGKLTIGKGIFKFGELDMSAGANVNSVVVNGGSIKGSVTVKDNIVKDVNAIGGMANVNSLVVNSK